MDGRREGRREKRSNGLIVGQIKHIVPLSVLGPTHLVMPAIEGIGENEEEVEDDEEEEEEQEEEKQTAKATESGARPDPLFPAVTPPVPSHSPSFSDEISRAVSASGFHDDTDDSVVTCEASEIDRKADSSSNAVDETVGAEPDFKRRGMQHTAER